MEAAKEISTIATAKEVSDAPALPSSMVWAWMLAVSSLAGIGSGIAGLILSFLAAESIVRPNSGVRLAVPILIVSCLSLLMVAAHAMDRMQDLRQ